MRTTVMLRELSRLKLRLSARHYKKHVGNTLAMLAAWIGMSIGALSGAMALAVHFYQFNGDMASEATRILAWIFGIMSLIWLFSPFAQIDVQRNLDLNGLRLMPLSGSQFLLAVLLDALLSPLSLFVLPIALLFLGIVRFAGVPFLPMLVSLLLLLAILMSYTQAIFLLVSRLLQSRRFAELSMLFGLVIVVVVQIVNLSMINGSDDMGSGFLNSPLYKYVAPVQAALSFSFPVLAARSAVSVYAGNWLAALAGWSLMVCWLLPGILLLGRTARSFYEGELESGGVADEHRGSERSRGLAGLLPPGLLQALVEREQRYARRDPMFRSLLIQSLFFAIYTCVVMILMRGKIFSGDSDIPHHVVNYVLLGLSFGLTYSESGILFNRFGYEGNSLASLLVSPVSRRSLLIAKSLFLLTHLGALNVLLVLAMGLLLKCSALYIAAALLLIIINTGIVDMAGSFLSISHPLAFVRQGRRVRAVMPQQGCGYLVIYGLLFNVCNLIVLPGSLAIVLGTVLYGASGLALATLLAGLIVVLIWRMGLPLATQLLENREHRLLEVLSRSPD